jgi:hypothetical protein
MVTVLLGLITVCHMQVIDCRNQHLSNSMVQVSDVMYTVHQEWHTGANYAE